MRLRRIAHPVRRRGRLVAAGTAGLVLAGYAGYLVARPALEEHLRARLQGLAAARGFSATIGGVHLTASLRLELKEVLLENRRVQVATRSLELRPRLSPRGLLGRAANLSVGALVAILPGGIQLDLAPSRWALELPRGELRLARREGGGRLELRVTRSQDGAVIRVAAAGAPLSGAARVRLRGCPVLDPGTLSGEARLELGDGVERVSLRGQAGGLSLGSLSEYGEPGCSESSFGSPTDVALDTEATVRPGEGSLVADRLVVAAGALDAVGRLRIDGGWRDPRIDLVFEVERLDFARLLATAGLDLPARNLGSASLEAHVWGRLRTPSLLRVTQRLDFDPPARLPTALTRLRGPFLYQARDRLGRTTPILVAPESPDFVPLAEVPPLFLRALLIAEDANFYGHPGIDLGELPVALATNLARGAFVRGASTISQQLAKNLFLSRTKTLGRKLEEASLALLLDSALGKRRELEIYLNVIEWGPGIYGLRPASRHYFAREPQQLTPRQIAFLVSLIPGPVKYQASFASGTPTPFFEGRMTTLLGKLVDVGALGDADYAAALRAPLGLALVEAQPAGAGALDPGPVDAGPVDAPPASQ